MKKKTPVYDVFLSHSLQDKGLAAFVQQTLSSEGLSVFELSEVPAGSPITNSIREGLVDSSAVILLITPSSERTGNLAFEAGMAMAWSKSVFVLYDGRQLSDIPEFLRQFQIFPVDKVRDVAKLILQSKQMLKPDHAILLRRIFHDTGITTDRLLLEPAVLMDMSDQFYAETRLRLSGSRIAQELIRMRKTGHLPKLRQVAHSG
jgi:hypothetical protein